MMKFDVADIDDLLDKQIGDQRVLKQIRRAIEHDEVISATELSYLQRLVDGQRPKQEHTEPERREVPVSIPESPMLVKRVAKKRRRMPRMRIPRISKKLVIIVIGIMILAGGAYSLSTLEITGIAAPQAPVLPAGVMLDTDEDSYSRGEIILVNGRSVPGSPVSVTIEIMGRTLWNEDVRVGGDGIYTTMVIAGGDAWQEGAMHTVTATDGAGIHRAEFLLSSVR